MLQSLQCQWLPVPLGIHYNRNTLCYKCISALLCPISVTVFSFTHHPVLSTLLLTLPVSRFLVPDFPLLVLAPFLPSAPLHGMTFPFLSDRNSLWTHSNLTSRHFISKTVDLPCFLLCAAIFLNRKSLFIILVGHKLCIVYNCVCMCLCVHVYT